MALPILAKKITSALVKKGSDAKKESKNVSTEKLLPGSSDKKKAKVSKFKSKTPRPYRKKFQPTKFLPPSKIDENFDMAKLDDLLASLVSNTDDLKKATKKDVDDTKKRGRKKKDISQKLKRQSREGRIESKAAKPKVVKAQAPLKLPKTPDFFKDILGVAGRLVLATGVMSILNFFTDPEKKDGFINLISNHMDKIILGALGALAVAIGSSLLPMFGIATTLFSLLLPVVSGIVGLLLNPGVWAAVLTALAIKSELDRPAGEYDQLEGDNAAWKNPRLTSRQRVITVATIYGKDRSQWPKEVVEELNRLNEKSDERDKDATKFPLPGIFSGGPLYSDPSQYQDPGDLTDILPNVPDSYRNSTSSPTEVTPMVKPQTPVEPEIVSPDDESPRVTPDTVDPETETGEGSIEITGDGSGGSGTLTFKKGGKVVGSQYKVYSGVRRTWGTSQEDRRNVSGDNYPMPDGTYPLIGFKEHGPWPGLPGIGDWSTFINPGGTIGSRSGIMLHNDIGSDGTAGCIGVELGGTAGTSAEKNFLGLYKKVNPKKIKVSLASGTGSSSSVNRPNTPDTQISRRASYERSGTQVAFVKVPTPTPVPMSSGETVESGGFTGGSSSNVNSYENLVLSSHYREA